MLFEICARGPLREPGPFEWLDQAHEQRGEDLIFFRAAPYSIVYAHPRFEDLVQRLQLGTAVDSHDLV